MSKLKLYSNEIVFSGHPDKICDRISDALLDAYMSKDKNTRAGIECIGGKGIILVTGEVTSKGKVDVEEVVKRVLDENYIDFTEYKIIDNIGKQSPDISQGVDTGGAGDQGMMFGYACNETEEYLPVAMVILQNLSKMYNTLVKDYPDTFFPDGKAQITGYYDEDFRLVKIKTFTISYQNAEIDRKSTDGTIKELAQMLCNKYGIEVEKFLINPTGKFFIGSFEGDAGLTGRKIVVDTYQSFAPVGGGAFSGKDPTKVDRSASYKARQLAIRTLKSLDLKWCEVQLSYAIGVAEPLAIYINSDKGVIEPSFAMYQECKPQSIIKDLGLKNVKYENTAMFGHFGDNTYSWEHPYCHENPVG